LTSVLWRPPRRREGQAGFEKGGGKPPHSKKSASTGSKRSLQIQSWAGYGYFIIAFLVAFFAGFFAFFAIPLLLLWFCLG
jgi:hypothetical protein